MDERSGAGWSEPGYAGEAASGRADGARHAFDVPAQGRYAELEMAGRGGMGEVVVVHDARLGRDVALKRLHAESVGAADAAAAARLAREAWITARLEHPAVVPIYDAGVDADGALYYTMRLIHGRSLAEVLRDPDAHAPGARATMLRHVVAVCQALAYAHSHGVIHRDIKPANVMVGGFGEVQVIDWGLAAFVDDTVATAFAHAHGGPAASAMNTGTVGTPGYMSPEQARGEPVDERADVWALGVMLHEVMTGTRFDPSTRAGRAQSGVEPALGAVIEKATAPSVEDRYQHAGDLYDDLARFLDGRRVDAHEYSTWELARRLGRRLRWPLLLVAAVAVTAGLVVALTVARIARERTRAQAAEGRANEAAAARQLASSAAMAGHAVAELADGAVAEAQVLAAHALAAGESADARGVAMATAAAPVPLRAEAIELPGCPRVVAGNWHTAVCQRPESVALWTLAPARERWSVTTPAHRVELLPSGDVLVLDRPDHVMVLDGASGAATFAASVRITTGFLDLFAVTADGRFVALSESRVLSIVDLERRLVVREARACLAGGIAAIAAQVEGFWLVCGNGDLQHISVAAVEPTRQLSVAGLGALSPSAMAVSADGQVTAIGGIQGDLRIIDLDDGTVTAQARVTLAAITHLEFMDPLAQRLLVGGDSGATRIWDRGSGAEALRLPAAIGVGARLTPDGMVSGGQRAVRWQLPVVARPRALRLPTGLASVAAQGAWLAIGRADGVVELRDYATGALRHQVALGADVIKALDFAPDGRRLAVSITGSSTPPLTIDLTTLAVTTMPLDYRRAARRLAFDAVGNLLAAHFDPPVSVWSPSLARRELALPELVDLSVSATRDALWLLAIDGQIWRWHADGVTRMEDDPSATMIAAWPGHARPLTGHVSGIGVPVGDVDRRFIANTRARLTDLIASPDGRYAIAGRADGTLSVWRLTDGVEVAVLRGHTQRVAQLLVGPDGRLVTIGWDGQLLWWDLAALTSSSAGLVQQGTQAWGSATPRTP